MSPTYYGITVPPWWLFIIAILGFLAIETTSVSVYVAWLFVAIIGVSYGIYEIRTNEGD